MTESPAHPLPVSVSALPEAPRESGADISFGEGPPLGGRARSRVRRPPAVPVSFTLGLLGLLLLAAFVPRTTADNDLWGHVRFGREIVATGSLETVDRYSFTSDRPWVNHEWLAEVIMAIAFECAGGFGLVWLKLFLLALAFCCLARAITIQGAVAGWRYVLLGSAALASIVRIATMRPQVFSIAATAVLLLIMVSAKPNRLSCLIALPILFGVWANVHGGWLVGLLVLGLWAATRVFSSGVSGGERWAIGAASVAAVLATALNPYGIGLWHFLWQTVGLSRPDITEWESVWSFPVLLSTWLPTTAVAAEGFRRGMWRTPSAFLIPVLGVLSFKVGRLDVFYGLATSVLIAPAFACGKRELAPPRSYRLLAAAVVSAVLVLCAFESRCLPIPEYVPERAAVEFIRSSGTTGRFLTAFPYGEYAIWHTYPAVRVSYDGRRETVYSDKVIEGHNLLEQGKNPGFPDAIGADHAWLPRGSPASLQLERAGWRMMFAGPRSVILSRAGVSGPPTRSATVDAAVCFPGP